MDRNRLYHVKRQDSNTSNSMSEFFTQNEDKRHMRKLVTPSSSLEIVDGDPLEGASGFDYDRSPSGASSRPWSRSSVGSVPPRSDSSLSRRTLTPTKQVSLQAVRRREESSEPFVDHIDVDNVRLPGTHRQAWGDDTIHEDDLEFSKLSVGDHRRNDKNKHLASGKSTNVNSLANGDSHHEVPLNSKSVEGNKPATDKDKNKGRESSSSDEDEDETEGEEDEKKRAPNELLMEFVDCLMKKDFPNASKLCKMILLYEPENEEALKFQPLIEEKLKLDEEAAAAEDEEGSSGEDDDDDDDDDDSDDSSSDDDDDDDSSDDDDDKEDAGATSKPEPPNNNRIVDGNASRVWKPAS